MIACFVMTTGCQVPQRVTDDVASLKADEQALFDFNSEFLRRAKSSNSEELQKKLKIIMISTLAHERASRGIILLAEYLDSSEIITNSQLAATEEMAKRIADKVTEKLGNSSGSSSE